MKFLKIAALVASAAVLGAATAPHLDKARFAEYIKYAEGLTDQVTITIDDPVPSPAADLYRVAVHMRAGTYRVDDKRYFVTADGQHFLSGDVWQLGASPFAETLRLLPDTGLTRGPAAARVTVFVFSDFQCPFCKHLA